jgi:hypothetical protein
MSNLNLTAKPPPMKQSAQKTSPSLKQEFIREYDDDNNTRIETDRLAKSNKDTFMENYCQDFEIPELNVLDAQINENQKDYYFQLVKYIFPSKGDSKVITYNLGKEPKESEKFYDAEENFGKYHGSIVLRVLKRHEYGSFVNKLSDEYEYVLKGAHDAILRFSDDGKKLAIFYSKKVK